MSKSQDSSLPGYNPTPPGYNPPPQGQTQPQTVIIQQGVPAGSVMSPHPFPVNCPTCKTQVVTRVEYVSGALTWIACLGIAFFGGILGCCLIPFCIDGCKDALHSCPQCNTPLGKYSRI